MSVELKVLSFLRLSKNTLKLKKMHLIDLYQKQDFVFSIEIFPPKTEKGMEKLKTTLEKFKSCTPDYFSVTYGAGGTSRANTHEMAAHIHHELDVPAMAHLTCVAHTEKEIDEVLTKLKNSEITNVMTLRGDPTCWYQAFCPAQRRLSLCK